MYKVQYVYTRECNKYFLRVTLEDRLIGRLEGYSKVCYLYIL